MAKSENINMTQLSQYLNSKFMESGRSLSDEIENSEAVVDAMKKIYKRENGYEILKDNRRFLSYLRDFLPQNKSYILKFFGEPEVTSILMRFTEGSSWDNEEYERQIQLAIRDLDTNVGKKVEDAQTIIVWTLLSFGKELSVENSATLSETAENFYQQAVTHYNNKEYQEALDLFLKAGNLNHAAAQNFIGVIYHEGLSVEENKVLALKWYKKSAINGNVYAATNVGWMLKGDDGVESNYSESIKYYLLAYNHGHKTTDVLFSLGRLNAQQGNFDNAKKFYEENINEFNDPASLVNLGVLYRQGKLGDIDNKKALELYERAAELNDLIAYSNLGYFYENGIEVNKDFSKALELYEKAVELGYDEAKTAVKRVKNELCLCSYGKKYKNCHGLTKLNSVAKQLLEYSEASDDFPAKFTGKARFKWANGTIYEGDWKDAKQEGQGKMMWADGIIYEGDWKDAKQEGQGKMMWADGTIYEGDWKDAKIEGQGKMMWADGIIYEGDWKDWKQEGQGKMMWADGTIYEGDWKDAKQEGQGKMMWADGTIYEGDWKDAKQEGQGNGPMSNI